jgi:hypothetical protein
MPDEPFNLFIASDHAKIVVATRCPKVEGRSKAAREGSVVDIAAVEYERTTHGNRETVASTVSTQPPANSAGEMAVFVVTIDAILVTIAGCFSIGWWAGPLLGVVVSGGGTYLARRWRGGIVQDWPESHVVLTDWAERDTIRRARSAATAVTQAWPKLQSISSAPVPDQVLARSLWDLALAQKDRQTMCTTHQNLKLSLVDLPRNSQMYTEVQARVEQASRGYAAIDAEVARRLSHLTDLADRCRRFLQEQAALDRARHVVRGADEVLGAIPLVEKSLSASPTEELASSTAAVLDAYRELSLQLGVEDVP